MRNRQFPPDFRWGAATASYQIEGSVAADGRGESIWDRFAHTPGKIVGGDTGDVACDHYRYPIRDVALIEELGLNAYRFSIAWPRILPDGGGVSNAAGLDFYDRLVDALLARGIEPHATLYHWDLPQVLEDRGGWPVRATAEAFVDYAAAVGSRLGDRLASLATINEPWVISDHGYRVGRHAPGRTDPVAALATAHHLLVAHGMALAALRSVAPRTALGIVLNFEPKAPLSADPLDIEEARIAGEQVNDWYLDPIVGRGYPERAARAWGWRADEVRPGDMELISQPLDFLGVNYYTRHFVRSRRLPPMPEPVGLERTGMGWEVHPAGLTEVLESVAERTGDLPLYVTENGAAYPDDPAQPERDPQRVSYLHRHLDAALTAMERGVPLRGYFVWSLLDNFEWAYGYAHRFGIIHVDFATQRRTIRDSGRFWAAVARDGLPSLPAEGEA